MQIDQVGSKAKMVSEVGPQQEKPSLDVVNNLSAYIRGNSAEINNAIVKILVHLRGETLSKGESGELGMKDGILDEITRRQRDSLANQRDTLSMLTELTELLSVNA